MSSISKERWNMFVAEYGNGLRQSWEWGEFQRALGREVSRWQADNGALAAQIIAQPLPFGRSYFYIPRGPVILNQISKIKYQNDNLKIKESISSLLRELRKRAAQSGAIFLRIEPGVTQEHPLPKILKDAGFIEVRSGVQPQETLLIDLTKSEDELLAAMHHKTRYNVRLAERHGVTVGEQGPEIFPSLWSMFEETARRDKFEFHSQQYYQTMLDILRPIAIDQLSVANYAHVRLWVAQHNRTVPFAAAIVGYFGKTAAYLHGASSSRYRNLMAPHLLHWRIMQDAKRRGYTTYDFGGISETAWPGVTRFKKGFGGAALRFAGVFDLPLNPILYRLYRLGRAVR